MEKEEHKSKISNVEWGMVIAAILVLDGLQALLDFIVAGVVINRFIDVIVGMILFLYFYIRGVRLSGMRIILMLAALIGEEIPGVDAFPLWSGYVIYMMLMSKTEEKLERAMAKSGVAGEAAMAAMQRKVANKQIAARRTALESTKTSPELKGATPPPLPTRQQTARAKAGASAQAAPVSAGSGESVEPRREGELRGKINEAKKNVKEEYGRFKSGVSAEEAARLTTGLDLHNASKEDLEKLEREQSGKEPVTGEPALADGETPQQAQPSGTITNRTSRYQNPPALPRKKDLSEVNDNRPPLPRRTPPPIPVENTPQEAPESEEQSLAE